MRRGSWVRRSLDSLDRLREYQRGALASGSDGIASAITLPGTDTVYTWNLHSVGHWTSTTRTPVGGAETTGHRTHNKRRPVLAAGPAELTCDASGTSPTTTREPSRRFLFTIPDPG